MRMGAAAGKTAAVFANNFAGVVKFSAIATLASILTLGLLSPVMFAGMGAVFRKFSANEKPGYSDLFGNMNKTLQLFVLSLVIALAAAAGIVFIFLPIVILAFFMYAPLIMAGTDSGIRGSLAKSFRLVSGSGIFGHITASLVLCVLNAAGLALFGAGLIVTFPLTAGFVWFCYEETGNKAN
jgi:hypothetical protein